MADVFISYASEDRDRAGKLASALTTLGWSVWWDRKIITGQTFDQAIERELETAKSVVVLWSISSVESEWVKNEASLASERGVLVPALIDSVKLPLEFRRKQTADLVGWRGDPAHTGFQALCEGIAASAGSAAPRQPVHPREQHSRPPWLLAGVIVVMVVLALIVYRMRPWHTSAPASQSNHAERVEPPKSKAAESAKPSVAAGDLADLVVGNYYGGVIADSKGSSRSDVAVAITKIDRTKVRVSSEYSRLGTADITLTRTGNQILNADGDTPFLVDLDRNPPTLLFDPRSEIAYRGNKQK
jgi:Na+-transporting methylmalonyl-CoA/oxaloacetate decarboxylase gamma subunit